MEAKIEKIKKQVSDCLVLNIDQFLNYKKGNFFSDEMRFESFLLNETKDTVE